MKPPLRHFLRLFLAFAAAALLTAAGRAEGEGSTARVKFSDPTKPGTLKLGLPSAEMRITGTDGGEIVVTSSLDQKGRAEVDDEGFRRLDEDVTFELVEKDNVATISLAGDTVWSSHGAEFEIQVPRNTNLVISTSMDGEIEVDGVEGDIDINSMNGEIVLRDIASSAVVNTLNGEISASFKHAPVKPVSLSTMNGEIDVRLPGDTKANLRIRTHNGSIRTNFPENALQTKTEKSSSRTTGAVSADDREAHREMAREQARLQREQAKIIKEATKAAVEAARVAAEVTVRLDSDSVASVAIVPPVPPVPPLPNFGGKTIVGTLNGGGVDIKLTSMNGSITLREAK